MNEFDFSVLTAGEPAQFGKYGSLRLRYLKENKPTLYQALLQGHLVHQTPTCWGNPQSPGTSRRCHNLPYEKIGKNDPVCIADEVPFEIPESWEWVRLGSVCQLNDGKKLQSKTYNNLDARYMRGKAEAKALDIRL